MIRCETCKSSKIIYTERDGDSRAKLTCRECGDYMFIGM
jgi:ribosomal protein S27E